MTFRYKDYKTHEEYQKYIGELLDSIHHSLLEMKEDMREEHMKKKAMSRRSGRGK